MCCWSSYTWPAYIWTILSLISAITVSFSIYFSNWIHFVENGKITSLSTFRICPNSTETIQVSCEDYLSFENMYSDEWRACTIILGIGACLLILVALTAIFGMFIPRLFNKCVTAITAVTQILAVLLLISAVLLFPAGFGASKVKKICRTSEIFNVGECQLGWAYIVNICGVFIAIISAFLSWTPGRWKKNRSNSLEHIPYDS